LISDVAKKRALVTQIVTLTMNPALDISTSVDKVVPTHKLRCSEEKIQPGGGGINIARVVRRLGTQATAIYPSGGFTGELLTKLLEKEGVQSQGIAITQETRECFTVHETSSGQDFRFLLPGPTLSLAEQQACADAFDQQSSATRFMVASGSLPPGVLESFYARLARRAKERSQRFVLDTSGPALRAALEIGVYLFKPSLRELEELLGQTLTTEAQWREAAQEIVGRGQAEVVALSLGEEGALLVTAQQSFRAPAVPVKVVSTVGAGDNFVAGILWGLCNQHALEQAFGYGLASAAAAVMNVNSNLCEPADLHRLYQQVRITTL
jgi:6-phosphofructokinase 2